LWMLDTENPSACGSHVPRVSRERRNNCSNSATAAR
jgi:hypothetical protein